MKKMQKMFNWLDCGHSKSTRCGLVKSVCRQLGAIFICITLPLGIKGQTIVGYKIDSSPLCNSACDAAEDVIQTRYTVALGQGFDPTKNYYYLRANIFRSVSTAGTPFEPLSTYTGNDSPFMQVRSGVLCNSGGTPANVFSGGLVGTVSRISNEHGSDVWTWTGDDNLYDTSSGQVVGYISAVHGKGMIVGACSSSYHGQTLILDMQFTINYGKKPINDNNDGAAKSPNNPPCGMPLWSVSEPYISLWLKDEPLGYQPALGPRLSFELAFKQRESVAGLNPNIFSVGSRWNCSWLSYVAQDYDTNNVVYFPSGGSVTYYTTSDYLTQTTLTGDATNGFTLSYPDGSKDVYGFIVTNNSGTFQSAFLTQRWNPQAQKATLNYFTYTPSFPQIRLKNVVDGDGRTNTITYATNNVYSTNLIAKVTDPFGRSTTLSYNTNGDLTNIVDVMTNSTSFNYDTNDWVTNMTTPYGTTSFTLTDSGTNLPPNGRSVLITRPDGSHEYYLYQDNAPGIVSAYPTNQAPNTMP